jgi:hypothetical protein
MNYYYSQEEEEEVNEHEEVNTTPLEMVFHRQVLAREVVEILLGIPDVGAGRPSSNVLDGTRIDTSCLFNCLPGYVD